MKKFKITACAAAAFLMFAACAKNDNTNIKDDASSEYSFAFETQLAAETKSEYPAAGMGKTYYVSAKGNDENDGLSKETPIKSIKKVNTLNLQAGDTIRFKGGEAFTGATLNITSSGAQDEPITVCGYDDETQKPKIIAQKVHGIVFKDVSNLVIRDLEIVVLGSERVSASTPAYAIGIYGDYSADAANENVYIVNNEIHGANNTSSCGIKIGSTLKYSDNRKDVVKNISILNNKVYSLGIAGIYTDAWYTDIKEMCSSPQIYQNVKINGNETYDIAQIAIYEECCYDSEINRNLVYDSGKGVGENAWLSIGQTGIMALGCKDTDIMFNEVYDIYYSNLGFDGMGIDIDWHTDNVNVQYNYTYNCEGSGIGTMANNNSFIRNNRVEKNKVTARNQFGQIGITDFTARNQDVPNDMHAVKNLKISDNLIINDKSGVSCFGAKTENGDSTAWAGNVFENNRCVSLTDTSDFWMKIDTAVVWYKYANNKYYKNDVSKFTSFDSADSSQISPDSSAYDGGGFDSWKKRDVGATFETLNSQAPLLPSEVKCSYSEGALNLTWTKSSGDLWHYNVYLVADGESANYRNMLGEAFAESFSWRPQTKGTYTLVIEPESNQGNSGKQIRVKVILN